MENTCAWNDNIFCDVEWKPTYYEWFMISYYWTPAVPVVAWGLGFGLVWVFRGFYPK